MKHVEKLKFKAERTLEPFFTELHVKIDSTNTKLFSSCNRKEIKIVDIESGATSKMITVDGGEYASEEIINFTISNSDDIAIAYSSGILRHFKWSTDPMQLLRTWKGTHIGPIARMAFDPTAGQLLATGGCDSLVKIWDTVRLYCTHNLKGVVGVVTAITFQPEPKKDKYNILAAGDHNYQIAVWNLMTSTLVAKLEGHVSTITAIKYLPNDNSYNKVLSTSRDKIVIIWDIDKQSALKKFPVYESIEGVAFISSQLALKLIQDEAKINKAMPFMTVGECGAMKLWDANTGVMLFEQQNSILKRADDENASPAVTQLVLCSQLNQLALTTPENNILFYKFGNKKLSLVKQLAGHVDEVLCVRFVGKEQKHLLVASNSPVIKIFAIDTMSCTIIEGHTDIVLSLAVFDADRDLFVSTSKDNTLRIWRFDAVKQTARCYYRGAGHSHSVLSVSLPKTTTDFAITGSEDTTMKVWKVPKLDATGDDEKKVTIQTLSTLINVKAHDKDINSIAIAPNDRLVCTASQDKIGKLWTLSPLKQSTGGAVSLELIGTLRGHRRGIWCTAFSSVDQIVATGSSDMTIKIWAISDQSCLRTFQGHDCSVLALRFCTRGMQIASVATDGNMKLWSVKSGECVSTLDAHSDKTWSLDMSETEELIVTAAADSRIFVVWRDTTAEELEIEAKERDTQTEQAQGLANLMKNRKWTKALRIAIQLEQPFRCMNILKEIVFEGRTQDEFVQFLADEFREDQLITLLRMAVEWNKNSKHSFVAQLVIRTCLTKIPPDHLLALDDCRTLLASLLPYTERHLARTDRLCQQSMFLDFLWSSMKLKSINLSSENTTEPEYSSIQ